MCGLVFLVNLGRIVYAPLLETFRVEFAATAGEVGLLATLAWIGSASLRFPTGYLLTKVPRHWVVLSTGLVLAGGSVIAANADGLRELYVGALAMGVASGMYFVSANPLVSELFPERVGRAIGVHGMSMQLAAVSAPAFVTVVFAVAAWPVADWRVVFLSIAVLSVLATAVFTVMALRHELPRSGHTDRALLAALRVHWPLILTGVAIVGVTGLVWNGVFNLYVTYLVDTRGLGASTSRNLLTVVFAAGVPAFVVSGRLADRLPFVPYLLTIVATFSACLVALTMVRGLPAIALVSVALGYVIHSLFPAIDTYLLSSFNDAYRGSAYALFSGTMMPIQATGSVILGSMVDAGLGFDRSIQLLALASLIVGVTIALAYAFGLVPRGQHRVG